jgi:hypothetical protein
MALPLPPATSPWHAWLGTWSRPPDRPSQIALAIAAVVFIVAFIPGGPRWLADSLDVAGAGDRRRPRRFLFVMGFVGAFLSLGYVAFYLRGGPRAPEGAPFWLQGRALLHAHLTWAPGDPSASFRARDLVYRAPDRLGGIFPPGYALLLAPAFLLGAPMLVGPLLAAALVPITWLLAREIAQAAGASEERAETAGRVAIGLSLVSVALRYHTAESLPHGAAAFALAAGVATALRARRVEAPRLFWGAGLALGLLLATQPVSAIAGAAAILALAFGATERGLPTRASLAWTCAGALPGVALLLAANHAVIGHAFASPIAFYGRLTGAHPEPVGFRAYLLAVARLLRAHLTDVENFEPLAFLPLLLLGAPQRKTGGLGRGVRVAVLVIAVQAVVLLLVTHKGDPAPAAGLEGLLVHLLPIEHALIALAFVLALPEGWSGAAAALTIAFALAGFAVHVSHDLVARAAEGLGRPRFEPDVAREGGVTHGLLFFEDEESYEFAADPWALPSHGVEAIRLRGDDHDRLAYDLLGHPQTHRYLFQKGAPVISSWTPSGSDTWRFEAEADYPPVVAPDPAVGEVSVLDTPGTCSSDVHVLSLTPVGASPDAEASTTIELPVPRGPNGPTKRTWTVTPRSFQRGGAGAATLTLVDSLAAGSPALAEWSWSDGSKSPACSELATKTLELSKGETQLWLVLKARGGAVALDRTTLRGH